MDKKLYRKRYEKFVDVLKVERTCCRITQEELAKKLGVTQTYISKIERGDRRIDVIELMEYCKATGISLSILIQKIESRLYAERLDDRNLKKSGGRH